MLGVIYPLPLPAYIVQIPLPARELNLFIARYEPIGLSVCCRRTSMGQQLETSPLILWRFAMRIDGAWPSTFIGVIFTETVVVQLDSNISNRSRNRAMWFRYIKLSR